MEDRSITLEEALAIVGKIDSIKKEELLPLSQLLNRIISRDVFSKVDMPPFDKSAMDGYACRRDNLDKTLTIIGEATAGGSYKGVVANLEAVRIMTGAPIPEGATMVVMKEIAIEENGEVRFTKTPSNSNICFKGEDIKVGELLIEKGSRITSRHIATLAASGYSEAYIYKQPKVAIYATGNELTEPGHSLLDGKIYNSNSYQLMAECHSIGLEASYRGILPDVKEKVLSALNSDSQTFDLVILSGGVSVGDYDFIPTVLQELGFSTQFQTLSTKPGKHTLLASKDGCHILGLPGNPVSTLTQFEFVGKAILNALQGVKKDSDVTFKAPLAKDYIRKSGDKLEFLPAVLNEFGEATLLNYNGSAHIVALSKATILISIEQGVTSLKKGDLVRVRPL